MEFTYGAYGDLLALLDRQGYQVATYHDWQAYPRCVILRHDIDNSPEQALALARVEREMGVHSTYFVLLRSEVYNVAARRCLETLGQIQALGHELGLHFDEKAYPEAGIEETAAHILRERDMLSALLETPVTSVSMHRPSQATLDADL